MFYTYEHWRTDLNVPFYVGKGDDARISYIERDNDEHTNICAKLKRTGHRVEVRLPVATEIESEAFDAEMLLIEIYRDAGIRLSNKTDDGEGSQGHNWSNEARLRQSKKLSNFYQTEEGKEIAKIRAIKLSNFYQTEKGKIKAENHGQRLSNFYQTEEGKETAKIIGEKLSKNIQTEEGRERVEKQRQWQIDFYKTEEGISLSNKRRQLLIERYSGSSGEENRQKTSEKSIEFYKTPEGLAKRLNQSASSRGSGNPGAKTTEETAQAILDFVGTHEEAAERFGVPVRRAKAIRERKTWRHLTPSKS